MHRPPRSGPFLPRRKAAKPSSVLMESVERRLMLAADVVISEFMASNSRTLADRDGDFSDWIEIHNRGDAPADLTGWYLTDDAADPDQWPFPSVTLAPNEMLIVFASEKDPALGGPELRANFRLERGGEYLGLVRPDGVTAAFEYAPQFPEQSEDVSYGLARPDAAPDEHAFFTRPTPGQPNQPTTPTSALSPVFSHESQTFAGSITVALSAASPTAQIRYTTNGSTPSAASPLYAGPVMVTANTQLRARVFEAGKEPGPVVTRTYVAMDADVQGFESNLPVFVLDTFGQSLSDTTLRSVAAYVIEPNRLDGRARMVDLPQFAGRGGLRYRGQSSQGFEKRPYAFETWDENGRDLSVPLLGMPAESDWILYNPYSEKSLLQNHLAYAWSNRMGRYASRTRFVEVFLNRGDGRIDYADYIGVYILEEKIKRDDDRVDIEALGPNDNTEPDVTGGYIFKNDKTDGGESPFYTSRGYDFLHVEPEAFELTPQQKNYLYGYLNAFEAALYGPNFADPVDGYAKYIDVDSWIDHHIMVEMAKNIDGFRISTYYHKDRGGKITMGPIWDYNLSMGNANYGGGNSPTGWYGASLSDGEYPYWRRLFQDPNFQQRYTDRWQELRRDVFRTDRLMTDVEAAVRLLADNTDNYPIGPDPAQSPNNALVRNFQRWKVLGVHLWPNAFVSPSYVEEVEYLKAFLGTRWNWMDAQYLAAPTANRAGGPQSAPTQLVLTGAGTQIFYTTDGSDPRLSGGARNPAAALYTAPISIDKTTRIRARAFSGGRWSGVTDLAYFFDQGLRVSEVMYHPHDGAPGGTRVAGDYEFVELHNGGAQPIDLGGYRFDAGIDYTFAAGTVLAPGQHLVLASDAAAFAERYPNVAVHGVYAGRLDDNGERLRLLSGVGVPVIDFTYDDGGDWPGRADGDASSLEPISPAGNYNSPKNWRSSTDFGGSPGSAAGVADAVVINEVLTRTAAPLLDAIELFNPTDVAVDVSGWYLSDSQDDYAKFRIPDGTVIPANGYLVFDESRFNPTPDDPGPDHFALDGLGGDDVWLVRADPDGTLRAFVDSVHFGAAAADGLSFGRWPNGSGRLRPSTVTTIGSANHLSAVGPVLISEVMYNHASRREGLEFVEIHNTTPNPVDLTGWRFDRGIDYAFPAGTILPAFGELLVVAFDPLDPREAPRVNLFRTVYNLSPAVPLVGGFSGRLDNAGDAVRLVRPGLPSAADPQTVPYVDVDEIEYEPSTPWSPRADGLGSSLGRVNPFGDGLDVTSWAAPNATPGVHAFSSVAITGSDGDDTVHVRLDPGGFFEIFHGSPRPPSPTYTLERGPLTALNFNGGLGDDRLTLDFGSAATPVNVDFNDAGGTDSLSASGLVHVTIRGARGFGDLVIGDGARVTLADGIAITADNLSITGGQLDLGTGQLLVSGDSLGAVSALVASARNGPAGRWLGPGITSSAAVVNPLATVAVRQTEIGTAVGYTLNGDMNFDGRVNSDDYFRIDSGFLAPPPSPAFTEGDLNYDGMINSDDYFLIDSAFLGQPSVLGGGSTTASLRSTTGARAVYSTATEAIESPEDEVWKQSSRRRMRPPVRPRK